MDLGIPDFSGDGEWLLEALCLEMVVGVKFTRLTLFAGSWAPGVAGSSLFNLGLVGVFVNVGIKVC